MSTNHESDIKEEIEVIYHACSLGRADIVKNAVNTIASKTEGTQTDIRELISLGRQTDDASPLHIACMLSHTDVIRSLLVSSIKIFNYI
jgi:hypothetical protein